MIDMQKHLIANEIRISNQIMVARDMFGVGMIDKTQYEKLLGIFAKAVFGEVDVTKIKKGDEQDDSHD